MGFTLGSGSYAYVAPLVNLGILLATCVEIMHDATSLIATAPTRRSDMLNLFSIPCH